METSLALATVCGLKIYATEDSIKDYAKRLAIHAGKNSIALFCFSMLVTHTIIWRGSIRICFFREYYLLWDLSPKFTECECLHITCPGKYDYVQVIIAVHVV